MNRPPRLSGSPASRVPTSRRESDRGSFSFSSDKVSSESLAAKHFGDLGKSDWSGSKSVDSIKQQYNAGE
jgi:hypothetical protein